MRGMVDYHMHSVLSDGSASYETMVRAAIEKGLDEVGFSDHVCLKPVSWALEEVDLPVMTRQILETRDKYNDLITVRYGIELDYFPGREEELSNIINKLPLDYVIGSIHFIEDWNFDSDTSLYGKWPNDELYAMYYNLVQQLAASNLFDIIGHLDIIKKFAIYPESDLTHLYEETARIIQKSEMVVELNTGGLDRMCAEFNPGPPWLDILHNYNIPVTITSDAHHPDQIARHYQAAVDALKKAGFREIITFNRRRRGTLKI
jgi:histidinol-phosphatase (PHP family)